MNPEKQMRLIQLCFVASAVMVIGVAYRIPVHPLHKVAVSFQIILGLIAISCGFAGFRLQKMLTRAVSSPIQSKYPTTTPLQRWRVGHVVRLATHMAIVLYAFVLYLLGGTAWLVDGLFALGFILLLTWAPGKVPAKAASVPPLNG